LGLRQIRRDVDVRHVGVIERIGDLEQAPHAKIELDDPIGEGWQVLDVETRAGARHDRDVRDIDAQLTHAVQRKVVADRADEGDVAAGQRRAERGIVPRPARARALSEGRLHGFETEMPDDDQAASGHHGVSVVNFRDRRARSPPACGREPWGNVSSLRDNQMNDMDSPERFEQLIAFVGAQLPAPVEEHQADDGSFIFSGGDPAEVVVQVTESTVLVGAFVGVGEEPDPLRTEPQPVCELHWRLLPDNAVMNALAALIKGAREARLATYRVCLDCGARKAPEHMQANDVCLECAEGGPGTIH
jgi:hypothetical protein